MSVSSWGAGPRGRPGRLHAGLCSGRRDPLLMLRVDPSPPPRPRLSGPEPLPSRFGGGEPEPARSAPAERRLAGGGTARDRGSDVTKGLSLER